MNSLNTTRVADTLQRLFQQAEQADQALLAQFEAEHAGGSLDDALREVFAEEARDLQGYYRGLADNFLNVTPQYGRFLYQSNAPARARRGGSWSSAPRWASRRCIWRPRCATTAAGG
nr:hypothetical protein [Burkholderia gladioli]